MNIKDKILLLIAMDDYETNKPGYEYSLDFQDGGMAAVTFYDEGDDGIGMALHFKDTPFVYDDNDEDRYFNDTVPFFEVLRELVYGV